MAWRLLKEFQDGRFDQLTKTPNIPGNPPLRSASSFALLVPTDLRALGTGSITMNTGSHLVMCYGANSVHSPDMILSGNNSYNGGTLIITGSVASTSVIVDAPLAGSGIMATATISGTVTKGYVTRFTVAVPEPCAALLGAIGTLLLLRRRR